tara:strand:- start:32302 stop:33582 length:1281 start_codon:yes stop_codon:yes gene_type:complete
MLKNIYNWYPRVPFFYGWLILIASFFSTFAATSVAQVVLGGIQIYILDDTGWDRANFSIVIALGTWISGFISPFIGKLADKYGPRQMMPLCLLIVGLCYFTIYGFPGFWTFSVGYIIARALSSPILISIVPGTIAVNFFRRKRGVALSIAMMSRPVAGAINVQLIAFITQIYGWRAAFNILGWFSILLSLPLFLIMRRRPEDIGLNPDGDLDLDSLNPDTVHPTREFSWNFKNAIKTQAFWILAMVASFVTLASSSVQFTLVPYYVDIVGLSKFQSATIFSVGTLLALATVLWGIVSDRISPRLVLIFILLVGAGLMILLINVSNIYQVWIFAILWGIFSGAVQEMTIQAVLAQYFGRDSYGSLSGAIGPMQITALGFGTTFGLFLHNLTGSYTVVYLTIGMIYVGCAVLTVAARQPQLNMNQEMK